MTGRKQSDVHYLAPKAVQDDLQTFHPIAISSEKYCDFTSELLNALTSNNLFQPNNMYVIKISLT